MKNSKFLFLAFALLVAFSACKKGGSGTVHRSGNGPQAKIGDIIFYDFNLKKDTTLIFSTAQQGQSAQDIMSDPNKTKDPLYHFVLQSLLSMKKGDSTSFVLPLDTFKVKPAGFEGAKVANLTISLKNCLSETEFLATLKPEEKESFMMQKKQMAVNERAGEMKDQIKAAQMSFDGAKVQFQGRSKAVADSMTTLAKDFAAGKMANVQTTASGLKYVILKEGTGSVVGNKFAFVNYYGCLKDGKKFDESFERGSPFIFPVGVGQVIPGWDEGVGLLKEGSTAVLLVPSALGYGATDKGTIPANSDLVFYIEVLKAL